MNDTQPTIEALRHTLAARERRLATAVKYGRNVDHVRVRVHYAREALAAAEARA